MAETTIKVKKVKYMESVGKIIIAYDRIRDGHCDVVTLVSDEEAAPEFYDSFKSLILPTCGLMDFKAEDFENRVVPYGVAYHYDKNDVMGAVISFKLHNLNDNTEAPVNTPMRKCKPDDTAEGLFFSESMAKFLWALELQARKYISGKRAQTTLFDEEGNVAEAGLDAQESDSVDMPEEIPPIAGAAQVIDFPQSAAH